MGFPSCNLKYVPPLFAQLSSIHPEIKNNHVWHATFLNDAEDSTAWADNFFMGKGRLLSGLAAFASVQTVCAWMHR